MKSYGLKNKLIISFMALGVITLPAQDLPLSHWKVKDPFSQKVFVENKGQFTEAEQRLVKEKILYHTRQGNLHFYFTSHSVVYRYDILEVKQKGEKNEVKEEEEEREKNSKINSFCISMNWRDANEAAITEVQDQTQEYFTYPHPTNFSENSGILAHAYRKLIYRGIYKNIDFEFYFPKDSGGVKYNIILHPGADASQIKMHYSSNAKITIDNGNATIFSPNLTLLDHAPVAQDEEGKSIPINFLVSKNILSFKLDAYDSQKSVIIDPWITTTNFTGTNKAYDIQYDVLGNVYVYGGAYPFELKKYSNTGVLQWTYSTVFNGMPGDYGDFATDARSGSSYIMEGQMIAGGTQMRKVNQAGVQTAAFMGNGGATVEMWRIKFDYCNNRLVIGAGYAVSSMAGTIDTNLTTFSPVNVLSATTSGPHDMCLLALDNNGVCYMATARSNGTPAVLDNVMTRLPLPSLAPASYIVSDGHSFVETSSVTYASTPTNGFNGMAATTTMLITYDGQILKKWNPATGAFIAQVNTGGTMFASGGVDITCNGNIYVGRDSSILEYNNALTLLNTYSVSDTIYDLILGYNGELFACGNGFVQQVLDTLSPQSGFCASCSSTLSSSTTFTNVLCNGQCNGTASANPTGGTGPYTYSWNSTPVQTTQTASGLCAGMYTVTVTDAVGAVTTSSVAITQPAIVSISTTSITNVACNGDSTGAASISVTGGTPSYTYNWSNGQTTATATGLNAGTYTISVADTNGCTAAQTITITQPNAIVVSTSTTQAGCASNTGASTAMPTGGTGPYTYVWNTTPTQTTQTATSLGTGTYTVTVTDSVGCSATATVNITSASAPTATVSSQVNPSCNGASNGSITITPIGGTAPYSYTWSPSGGNTSTATSLGAGTYTCLIADSNNCAITQTVTLTQPQPISLNISTSSSCGTSNGTATVSINSGGVSPFSYSWSPSGGSSFTASGLTAGIYSCTVTDANLCTQTNTISISTNPGPTVTISPDITIISGNTATLTATGGGIYAWSPASGLSCTSCSTTIASPTVTTDYCVLVTDTAGCTNQNCVRVTVDIICGEVFVPNAFSPNGDNSNDTECIYGKCLQSVYFAIYDRWGEKVFETNDPKQCWDGMYRGKSMNTGIFVYYLEATTFSGELIVKKGSLTLIR